MLETDAVNDLPRTRVRTAREAEPTAPVSCHLVPPDAWIGICVILSMGYLYVHEANQQSRANEETRTQPTGSSLFDSRGGRRRRAQVPGDDHHDLLTGRIVRESLVHRIGTIR